jgi:ubiquinone/menaquinone biosynthesis C-methylase UbiE
VKLGIIHAQPEKLELMSYNTFPAGRITGKQRETMDTKTVYSTKAEKYARFRWDYAAGSIAAVVELTHMSANSTVADLGAGTGILTRHFVGKAQKIYAIEPNVELRQILTTELGTFPSISVIDGSAEDTTLPDHSVDVITVAQAIHWFDPEPARQEMIRILKEKGWLALLRNYGIKREQNEVVRSLMTEEYGADYTVVQQRPKEKPARFYFGNDAYQRFIFPFAFYQNWEEFIGSLTTASFMPDEDHPLFEKLERKVREIFFQYSDAGYWKVEGETELIIGQLSK